MITADIERIVSVNDSARRNLTNALNGLGYHGFFPEIGDYMYYFADIWATGAQYGHRVEMCNMVLSEEWKNFNSSINLLHDFAYHTVGVFIDGYDAKSTVTNIMIRNDIFIR